MRQTFKKLDGTRQRLATIQKTVGRIEKSMTLLNKAADDQRQAKNAAPDTAQLINPTV